MPLPLSLILEAICSFSELPLIFRGIAGAGTVQYVISTQKNEIAKRVYIAILNKEALSLCIWHEPRLSHVEVESYVSGVSIQNEPSSKKLLFFKE